MFDHAAGWYRRWYGSQPVTTFLHDCDHPTVSPRFGVRVGGWVDLTVLGDDGTPELRQLDLWGRRRPPDDPLELDSVWLAVLRLARWAGDRPLVVSWADLVAGERREVTVRVPERLPELRDRLAARLDALRDRITDDNAAPGRDCGSCHHVWRCPAHRDGVNVMARPRDIRPAVLTLTPTSLTTWARCRRGRRDYYLLSVVSSDASARRTMAGSCTPCCGSSTSTAPATTPPGCTTCWTATTRPRELREEVRARRAPLSDICDVGRPRAGAGALPRQAAASLHGDGALRRAVGARRAPRRAATTRPAGSGTSGSPRTPAPRCRPGCSAQRPTRGDCGCGCATSTSPARSTTTRCPGSPTPTSSPTSGTPARHGRGDARRGGVGRGAR